jgi:hypothetical protein
MKTKWYRRWVVLTMIVGLPFCSPPANAQSPGTEAKPQNLRLVFPARGKEGEAIHVRYTLTDRTLVVNFEVSTRDIDSGKVRDAEIYNGNVVELFICTTAKPSQIPRPYYEFEVSPYNQELQVLIDKNGRFNEKWKTAGFKHSVTLQKDRPGWDATMEVPLRDLGWNGDPATLAGNAFAIVGAKGVRRFYSAYLPPQARPNFHQPRFFKPFPMNQAASVQAAPR